MGSFFIGQIYNGKHSLVTIALTNGQEAFCESPALGKNSVIERFSF